MSLTKVISSNAYREGSAVVFLPSMVLQNNLDKYVVTRYVGKDWTQYAAILANKFNYPLYYSEGYPLLGATNNFDSKQNLDVVITYQANPNGAHQIYGLYWSYSSNPNPGPAFLRINEDQTPVFYEEITTGGPGFFEFSNGFKISNNKSMQITLSAGGVGIVGSLTVVGHKVVP